MKAEVAFPSLFTAARALKPYTTAQRWRTSTRLLHLHAGGDTLTLTASTGEETASVPLDGAVSDGAAALPPDALINALTVLKPAGRAADRAIVTLHSEADRLHLSIDGGPTIDLDLETPHAHPPALPAAPALALRLVTEGSVADWCDLVAGVATAASHDPARPELAVVRLLRDHPQVVLMVEAADAHRIHRGTWGDPDGEPVDVRIPAEAAARAVRLLRTLDPAGHIRIDADDRLVSWRTDRIRLSATTGGGGVFPDLEKIREDVLDDATVRFTVDRTELLAVLDAAHRLTAPIRHPRIRLDHHQPGVLDVVVPSQAGTAMYTGHVPVRDAAGPVRRILIDPDLVRDAVAFLDGDAVTVHTIPNRLPTYLAGARRHAVVMQIAG